jgi:hypothetical protein
LLDQKADWMPIRVVRPLTDPDAGDATLPAER